jgi:electron transfer flavoprotein beta subunit
MTAAAAGEPLDMLVCTKFVPDPNQLQADSNGRPDLARAPFRISTFDENAIEAALQLRVVHGGRVVGLSLVGDQAPSRDVLLRALAMGLDALYLINDDLHVAADPWRVATLLAAAAHTIREAERVPEWRLVLCGEASADQYNAQLGPRLAVALGLPAVTYAARLEVEGAKLVADRSLESRSETVECDLPALATVGMEINQPRVPTVLQVMGAGRKPIRELAASALIGADADRLSQRPRLNTVDVSAPPTARKRIVIEGKTPAEVAAQLIARLGADGELKV